MTRFSTSVIEAASVIDRSNLRDAIIRVKTDLHALEKATSPNQNAIAYLNSLYLLLSQRAEYTDPHFIPENEWEEIENTMHIYLTGKPTPLDKLTVKEANLLKKVWKVGSEGRKNNEKVKAGHLDFQLPRESTILLNPYCKTFAFFTKKRSSERLYLSPRALNSWASIPREIGGYLTTRGWEANEVDEVVDEVSRCLDSLIAYSYPLKWLEKHNYVHRSEFAELTDYADPAEIERRRKKYDLSYFTSTEMGVA